jgi:nitroreductase
MPITPSVLLESLNYRYATKAFDPTHKITAETLSALKTCLTLTPSSFGLQPWKFIVVDSPEIREKLKSASWGQPQVTDASHLVVFTARTDLTEKDIDKWINRLSEVQETPIEKLAGYASMISSFTSNMSAVEKQAWNTRQVYIALGQLMTAAAVIGVDTCPLEGISPNDYDEILGLKDSGYATAVACALGYRSTDDKYADAKKARFPSTDLITHI